LKILGIVDIWQLELCCLEGNELCHDSRRLVCFDQEGLEHFGWLELDDRELEWQL
jgi:hypothetical protein